MIRRSAFTLTELVVTMSAGSTLMILAVGMIHQTMTLSSTARERADCERRVNRLADQFRHDVHLAATVTVESEQMIRLELNDGDDITYRASDHSVVRRRLVNDDQHQETYKFTVNIEALFSSQTKPARAVLILQRETGLRGVAPRVDRHIAAVVGHLRLHESLGEVTDQ